MKEIELAELTDQTLLEQRKKAKASYLINAAIIGVFIGIALYSTLKKGVGIITFFPLVFAYILLKKGQDYKAIEQELKKRNLK